MREVKVVEPIESCAGLDCADVRAQLRGINGQAALELEGLATDLRTNAPLCDLFTQNAARLGRTVAAPEADTDVVGSTDMGNVSYVVPSIHPMIAVAPKGVSIHTPEFALHAAGPAGDAAVIDGATAMAMTVADLWLRPEAIGATTAAFEAPSR